MNRTVSTFHLVLGIIFTGTAALWLIGQATDADLHDTAPGFPLVLIGAGIVGLIASVVNARLRRRSPAPASEAETTDELDSTEGTEDTTVLTTDDPSEEE